MKVSLHSLGNAKNELICKAKSVSKKLTVNLLNGSEGENVSHSVLSDSL